jgi:DNA-binding IclR family transcriptional regulator
MRTTVSHSEMVAGTDSGSAGIQVIDRAALLLTLLSESRKPLALRELADKAELQRSTARRILASLEKHGFCERDRQSRYRLGLRLFQFGSVVQGRLEIRECAQPHIEHLADETHLTVNLCVLQGARAVCIDRIDGHHAQSFALAVGGSLPLHAGAAPRALLAHLPEAALDSYLSRPEGSLERFTTNTITSTSALREDVEGIRVCGWSHGNEDVTEGFSALGAPVFDHRSQAIGAISASGLTATVLKNMERLVRLVTSTARATSVSFGSNISNGEE